MTDATTISFDSLGLPDRILQGVRKAGFRHCTAIQAQTLPIVLAGNDVAGQAQTGTGKTAAFLLASFNRLLTQPLPPERSQSGPRAVILAPTRELAIQIHADAEVLGVGTGFRMAVVFGGKDYEKQREVLAQGIDILIGTPGRFIDYFRQKIFTLNDVQVMVLDEADRMFDLGFIKDIRYVLRRLPPAEKRLNLLFSATLSQRVIELAYEHMNDPEVVRIDPEKMTVDRVTQTVYFPGNDEKMPLLIGILQRMSATRTMVFVNMKREAEHVAHYLQHNGVAARAISGDVPQNKRMKMLHDFQKGALPVLVATDVASRGLHVKDVSHVVNYDLPNDPEDYVHRIGRTARAGASGDAISFACETYAQSLPDIEAYLGHRIPTAVIDHDNLPRVDRPPRPARHSRAGRKDNRHRSSPGKRRGRKHGRSAGPDR